MTYDFRIHISNKIVKRPDKVISYTLGFTKIINNEKL